MRVALDISSTQSNHKFRGIGFYTERLYKHLAEIARKDPELVLVPFTNTVPKADLYHFPAFSPFFFSFPPHLVKQSLITIHDLIPIEYSSHFPPGVKGLVRWQIQRFLLKRAIKIVTDSQASKRSIIERISVPSERVDVVYLAADEVFTPIENQHTLADIAKRLKLPDSFVLYVGDMNWNKNIVMLAEVCVKLAIPLVVVGKQAVALHVDTMHPWNVELVKFQILAREHPQIINRLGFVKTEDLVALYNLARVLVHPAVAEGFGLPVLEAMQCGCPVIAGNRSSIPEITNDAALLFNPFSKQELEKTLTRIWNNTTLQKELSQKGKIQAHLFSWGKTAEAMVRVYKECYLKVG